MKRIFTLFILSVAFQLNLTAQIVVQGNSNKVCAPATDQNQTPKDILFLENGQSISSKNKYDNIYTQAVPANNNCTNAISLTVDAACIAGTTKEADVQT